MKPKSTLILGKWKNTTAYLDQSIKLITLIDCLYMTPELFDADDFNELVRFNNECFQIAKNSGVGGSVVRPFTLMVEAVFKQRGAQGRYGAVEGCKHSDFKAHLTALLEAMGDCTVAQVERARSQVERLTKSTSPPSK